MILLRSEQLEEQKFLVKFEQNKKFMSILLNDKFIYQEIQRTGLWYENGMLQYIRQHFSGKDPNDTFIDIGANTGHHTVFFSSLCDVRVLAFEPYTPSYNLLLDNALIDNYGSIRPFPIAIGKGAGMISMDVPDPADPSRSLGGVKVGKEKGTIPMFDLDTFLETLEKDEGSTGNIKLIKIDVEGGEWDVLKGAQRTIERFRPELFIETWEAWEQAHLYLPAEYKMKDRYNDAPTYHFSCNDSIPCTYTRP